MQETGAHGSLLTALSMMSIIELQMCDSYGVNKKNLSLYGAKQIRLESLPHMASRCGFEAPPQAVL